MPWLPELKEERLTELKEMVKLNMITDKEYKKLCKVGNNRAKSTGMK